MLRGASTCGGELSDSLFQMSLSSRVFLIRLLGIDVAAGSLGGSATRHGAKWTQSLKIPDPSTHRAFVERCYRHSTELVHFFGKDSDLMNIHEPWEGLCISLKVIDAQLLTIRSRRLRSYCRD